MLLLLKNKSFTIGIIIVVLFALVALLAHWLSPYSPSSIYPQSIALPPFWQNGGTLSFPLGTDDLGRDILSRLLHGARVSIGLGMAVVFLSLTTGSILGLLAGYWGGKIDWIIMRGIDILMTLPSILLAMVVSAILGPGAINTVMAISVVSLPAFTRIIRSNALVEKQKEYIEAAHSFGMSNTKIMFKEIFPNCLPALIVQASFGLSEAILSVAALGFLGLGVPPPMAEWGVMLSDARPYIESHPLMVTLPGLCILLLVLGFNLLGDGLRDLYDPKVKK